MSAVRARMTVLLELFRISNLPTCFTNVLVGLVAGAAVVGPVASHTTAVRNPIDFGTAALLLIAISLLYVGGMALNDVVDAPIDRAQRARRPIPSGRISRGAAFAVAMAALLGGSVFLVPIGTETAAWGVALLGVIVAYDVLHKRHPVFTILMGLCRGLVYVVAAVAVAEASGAGTVDWMIVTPFAAAMTVYIVLVTILARAEARPGPSRSMVLVWALPLSLLAPLFVIRPANPAPAIVMGLMTAGWIVLSARHLRGSTPSPPHAIMGWLAAICLADAWFLTLLDRPALAMVCLACFLVTTYGHRRILGS